MIFLAFLFIVSTCQILTCFADGAVNKTRIFPDDFKIGVATASYQIEGGWDADGKGEHIWDHLCHTNPTFVKNSDNGDVACDSYHKWREDVQLLKDLGVNIFRFSLSWSRILPNGLSNRINPAGIKYYSDLIDELLANGIEPLVTLYHWDLPQPLQELGGFPNPLIADYYADYARVAFDAFGDRVKYWLTFNEPLMICLFGYGGKGIAPALGKSGTADYLCAHTLIRAHAKAFHIYDDEFRSKQKGKVGITLNNPWVEPATNSTADVEAAERSRQFNFGWFAHPIFLGNYPSVMIERVAMRSKNENFTRSRLPAFTEEEIAYINGTHDFIGLNYYGVGVVTDKQEDEFGEPDFGKDVNVQASDTNEITGWDGFRDVLNYIKDTYNTDIIVTENGLSVQGETSLDDENRITYYKKHLNALAEAIGDGVNVIAYTAWSLMDDFEWDMGYNVKFGLYHVDFTSDNRTRTPKASAAYYKTVLETGNPQLYV